MNRDEMLISMNKMSDDELRRLAIEYRTKAGEDYRAGLPIGDTGWVFTQAEKILTRRSQQRWMMLGGIVVLGFIVGRAIR